MVIKKCKIQISYNDTVFNCLPVSCGRDLLLPSQAVVVFSYTVNCRLSRGLNLELCSILITVMFLNFQTDRPRSGQTVQTQIRLLLETAP